MKITGKVYRVLERTGSMAELNVIMNRPVTVEEVKDAFRQAAETVPLKGIMDMLEGEWVSSRIRGDPHVSIVDLPLTAVQQGRCSAWRRGTTTRWAMAPGRNGGAHRRIGR